MSYTRHPDPRVWAIVVAAGAGTRFGDAKPYAELGGRRILDWSLDAAGRAAGGVVLVVTDDRKADPEPGTQVVVAGGPTRSDSVRRGLAAVPADATVVLVHDAARPLAGDDLFISVLAALADSADPPDAVVPGVAVVDTMRRRTGGTVDREGVVAVQTPQGFRAGALRRAHQGDPEGTDDASLVEAAGGRVVIVPGNPRNLKITRPSDLAVAEALLEEA